MHKLLLGLPLLLASCATAPAPEAIPVHGETPGHTCNDTQAGQFVGQVASEQTGSAILAATNAATLRWAAPGMMLTMDFSPSRVTVRYGSDMKITAVNCG